MSQAVPPPNDDRAERAVLSAIFAVPASLYDVQGVGLRDGHFFDDRNRRIYRAAEALEASGSPYDSVTVARWLHEKDELKAIGGTQYLAQITTYEPYFVNVREHANIVRGLAHRRRLIDTLKAAAAEGYGDVGDPFAWAQSVEQRVFEASSAEVRQDIDGSLSAVTPGVLQEITDRFNGKREAAGTSTGLFDLDRRINGLKRKKTYLVAGRPGMGKTALIEQIGTHVATLDQLVVEISTEQTAQELTMRKLAQRSGVAFTALERGRITRDDWGKVVTHAERLRKLPLAIENMNRPTIGEIRSAIRRALAKLRREFGQLPIGLIAIDQIGHLDAEPRKGETRESEVARLSREITWIAGEFDCPLLLAAQLNRSVEQRPDKRPLLSDLRESGALEQDAFSVLFPFRPEYYKRQERGESNDADRPEECEVIVAKHKNGPAGSVALMFHGPSMAFDTPEAWGMPSPQATMFDGPPPDDPRFNE